MEQVIESVAREFRVDPERVNEVVRGGGGTSV